MITKLIGTLLVLGASVAVLNPSVYAEEAPRANIIDGLTYADTCLYMLESTRRLEQPDCDTLFLWHQESFPRIPGVESMESAQRARFDRNLALYLATLRSVKKILASKVTGQ